MDLNVSIIFLIEPPKIIPSLTKEDKDSSVVLLDFNADASPDDDSKNIRIDLDVVFTPKPIRRGTLHLPDWPQSE